jgi:hypothetical protein
MRLFPLLLSVSVRDSLFHTWCERVGIRTPLARLETSSRSIAGRGVFATDDIREGDIAVIIPRETVFFDLNAAESFPRVAKKLERRKRRFQSRKSLWRRLLRRDFDGDSEFVTQNDFWHAELTSYSLACLDSEHPWASWMSQWQRDDPYYRLLQGGTTWKGAEAIDACVEEMLTMNPDCPKAKLSAAIDLRLRRFGGLQKIFDLDSSAAVMDALLASRAIELGDGVTGVIPMFDMINHSDCPNLALSFDGTNFELIALRKIVKDEELFLSYYDTKEATKWDEDDAVWALVQWGIPMSKPARPRQELIKENLGEDLVSR